MCKEIYKDYEHYVEKQKDRARDKRREVTVA